MLFVMTLSTIFDACVSRLIVLWSSHVFALGFFFNGTITVCKKSSGHTPVLYISLQSCTNSFICFFTKGFKHFNWNVINSFRFFILNFSYGCQDLVFQEIRNHVIFTLRFFFFVIMTVIYFLI